MKVLNSKKGISLIVLIITIIVMIILAAAIILSLSNSGIIDKAGKAKKDSDTASLKEYANVLMAEYDLMSETERAGKTKEVYVNAKLEEKYPNAALSTDGEVYSNLTENSKEAIVSGIKIRDKVSGYNKYLTSQTFETSGSENTGDPTEHVEIEGVKQEITSKLDFEWIFIGINEDGKMEIVPDYSNSSKIEDLPRIRLSGKGGYLNGPSVLNETCDKLYSTEAGKARNMNISDVNKILGYTGEIAMYADVNYEKYELEKPITIAEAQVQQNSELTYKDTPDGKDITTYLCDYYYINRTGDVSEMTYPERRTIVYPATADNVYWLSSTCVQVYFNYSRAHFDVRLVRSNYVDGVGMLLNYGYSGGYSYGIRPVVEIDEDVSISYNTGELVLN